jgi:hypothetical protein
MDLRQIDLSFADLSRASLRNADLSWANLDGADLIRTDLEGADLRGVTFDESVLRDAILRDTNLMNTKFDLTDVQGADFANAMLGNSYFLGVDLRAARGLLAVRHGAPSSIDIDTLVNSRGCIPDAFLRGVGTPDSFITYIKSLTGAALDFYSVFISYSTKDQEFADRLYADLQARGVRCWFAPRDIQGGRKVHEQIDEAIRIYDKLVLILSDASMNSPWVKTEIANARARETQQKRQMLFPITLVPFDRIRAWKCFDADTGIDSAREIREYYVPDFSEWKNRGSYSAALERLVRDLKAESTGKGATIPE